MRKVFTIFVALVFTATVWAQSPQKMSYQAVIRNSINQLVINQTVGMRISILQGSAGGSAVYVETQAISTNANGLVSLEIGGGTVVSGDFSTINWAGGIYFIKTETDPTGGTAYTITGTSQLLSIPYALHAKTAESLSGTITETDPVFSASPAFNISGGSISDWSTAYSWGNHATEGYLTSYTETDPSFGASPANGITNTNITNWTIAFGWGNHSTAGYLTSFIETDPIFVASPANGITNTNITNWITAYNWGNHAAAGYLTSFIETDPIFSASPVNGITNTNITNWNSAYSWGNHSTAGYLTSFTETDPTYTNSQAANVTASDITNLGNLSGTNTGNQDLSGLATTSSLTTGLATKVDKEAGKGLAPNGTVAGQMLYWNGTTWVTVAAGLNQQLFTCLHGVPTWIDGNINDLSIGDGYKGGIIAYFLVSGDPGYDANVIHGLIAAENDQSAGIQWWNGSFITTGAIATEIGTGNANTNTIVLNQGAGSYAAQLCADLVLGGYSDWYLPSKEELRKLSYNQVAVGGFNSATYWSSSEFSYSNNYAIYITFSNSFPSYDSKGLTKGVRAIRAF